MILKIVTLVLVLSFNEVSAKAMSSEDGIVGISSSACILDRTTLQCNYMNYSETVYLNQPLPENIQNVMVKTAKKLQLSDTLCINISIYSTPDVRVRPGLNVGCESDMELIARDSTLDQIPLHTNRLVLENSSLASLSFDSILKNLTIVNSSIKVADISQPLQQGSNVRFVNSTVNTLHRLQLNSGSNLLVENSKLSFAGSGELVLQGGFGSIRNSYIDTRFDKDILLFPGAAFGIDGSSSKMNINAAEENNSSNIIDICPSITTYYGGFVTCLVFLILICLVTIPYIFYLRRLIDHIDKKSTKPDKYDLGNKCASFEKQVNQSKNMQYEEVPTEEKHSSNDDINMEQYQCLLENTGDLNDALKAALQSETTEYQQNLAGKKTNLEAEVEKLKTVAQEKMEQLENSKNFELQSLETQYNDEFNSPTMIFWDKIKDFLEQSKIINEKLIDVKYKSWKFDIRARDDVSSLQERVDTVSINKVFISNITSSIKDHLKQWPDVFTMIRETNIESDVAEKLFILLENLLLSYEAGVEENYERQIREQDNTYLSEAEEQKQELKNFITDFKTSTEREKENILEEKAKALESKLPWTKKYVEEVDNLYNVKEQLLDTTLNFEIKNAEDKYSETRLKSVHLDVIINIQGSHIRNLETMVNMITNAMDLSVKTLKLGIYDERDTQYNETRRVSNRSKQLFMDRYAQA